MATNARDAAVELRDRLAETIRDQMVVGERGGRLQLDPDGEQRVDHLQVQIPVGLAGGFCVPMDIRSNTLRGAHKCNLCEPLRERGYAFSPEQPSERSEAYRREAEKSVRQRTYPIVPPMWPAFNLAEPGAAIITPMTRHPDSARGFLFGILAYATWGLFPLFWPLLEPASPLEIVSCRILFCFAVVAALLGVRGQMRRLGAIDRGTALRLCGAGVAIAVNWGVYIWGVNNGHVVETSLGYFINPLVTIVLGVVILHERLRRVQWAAVGLGALAVAVLSIDYGRPPWIALILACSFATYGFIKKGVRVSPPEGLFVEGAIVAIPALVILTAMVLSRNATLVGHDATPVHVLLLVATGPVTALPLLCFAAAATRLPLSTMGLMQYLTPVMQFAIGVLIVREPVSPALVGGFALVWVALVILSIDGLRNRRSTPNAVAELDVEDLAPEPSFR